jgi:hypothetical protein
MKISNKKRKYISELWFYSWLKNSDSNLIMRYTESKNNYFFTIGKYSFDSITGKDHIEPLKNMSKLSFREIENLLNGLPKNTTL